jgi:serine/threonine-protein kinase
MHRDVLDDADTIAAPGSDADVDDEREVDQDADEDYDEDEDERDSLMLDEDSDAPNLVPEERPRGILAGRIEMLDKIGEGGMGAVWRGHHLKLDRPVAVKVLDETLQLRPDGRERFIREARALALLDHRNVARIYDCDQLPDGKLFLCMELLEGDTLRELIKGSERPDPLEVIDIGLQVCDAIEAAHARGILHRDLTPSNIIRLRDPGKTVKVIDWGLCKYLDLFYMRAPQKYGAPPGSRMVTPFGCRFGTPEYMAPEMTLRENPGLPSFCTDVYSLAVVLYELLTGQRPFVAGDRKKPRPIRSLLPGFDYEELETALRVALRYNPEDRTQTMAELREALELARECLVAQREPPVVADDEQAAPDAATAVVPATPLELASTKLAVVEERPARPVARTPPRGRLFLVALSLLFGAAAGVGGTLAAQRLGGSVGDMPAADTPSPALAASLAARASAAESRADRCETDAMSRTSAVEPESSPVVPDPATTIQRPARNPSPVLSATTPLARSRPRAPSPAPTFAQAMTRLESKFRGCASQAGIAEEPMVLQVRTLGGAIESMRVLRMSKEHPFVRCVEQVIRGAAVPAPTTPIEDFAFFKGRGAAAK